MVLLVAPLSLQARVTAHPEITHPATAPAARDVAVVPPDLSGGGTTLELPSPGHGWRPLKLYGGSISCIAVSPVDPNLVVAINGFFYDTGHGIFVSHDGGQSWSDPPIPGRSNIITAFDAVFLPDGTLLVATYYELLHASSDLETWTSMAVVSQNPDVRTTYIFKIAVNPSNPAEIWLGTQQAIGNASPMPRVLRTLDGGAQWSDVSPPLSQGGLVTGIAFDPQHPERVMAVGGGLGVWRTLDDGATWSSANTGLPGIAMLNNVVHDGSRFYLCGGWESSNNPNFGVFAFDEGIGTWLPEHTFAWPSRVIFQLTTNPSQPGTILAATTRGLFIRRNGVWSFGLGGTNTGVLSGALTPGHPSRIFAGNEFSAVTRSEDGGDHFVDSSQGIRTLFTQSAISNPENPLELAASYWGLVRGGVCTSQDGGETWTREALPLLRFSILEFGPGGVLYAVADAKTRTLNEGIYRRNGDRSWTHLGPSAVFPGSYSLYGVRVARHHPDTIFACGVDHAFQRAKIWRSINAGSTWSEVYVDNTISDACTDIQILNDGTDMNILVSRALTNHVLVSHDGGDTWSTVGGIPDNQRPYSLRGTPADPNTFYMSGSALSAGQQAPCMRSNDGGATWGLLGSHEYFDKMEVDRINPDIVYGFRQRYRPILARSVDGGQTYSAFDDGFDGLIINDIRWIEGPCPKLLLATDSSLYVRDIDSTPPQISLTLEPNVLWPPDHKLHTIRASVTASDQCDPNATFALKSIAVQDGSAAAEDVVAHIGEGTTTFQLRAERQGRNDRRYLVTYTATDASGNTTDATAVVLVPHDQSGPALTGGEAPRATPLATRLVSIEPNPFNPSTAVKITLAAAGFVTLDVYDVRGARVRSLTSGMLPAGEHRIAWDGVDNHGRTAASGVYFFRFVAGSHVQTMKALLIK
jgi:photosystem II stability/assembly factor-like uncharacterized protein